MLLQRYRRRCKSSSIGIGIRSLRVIVEPVAANMGVVPPIAGFPQALVADADTRATGSLISMK